MLRFNLAGQSERLKHVIRAEMAKVVVDSPKVYSLYWMYKSTAESLHLIFLLQEHHSIFPKPTKHFRPLCIIIKRLI